MWRRILVVCLLAVLPLGAQVRAWSAVEREFDRLCDQGDLLAAKELITGVLRDKGLAEDLHYCGTLLRLVGAVNHALGDFDEADLRFRAAISALERAGPPAILTLARAQMDFASLIELRGETKDAERRRRMALEILQRELGPDDPAVLYAQVQLAIGYCKAGESERAERLCREVIDSGSASNRFPAGYLAETWFILGKSLLGSGGNAGAAEAFRQSAAIVELQIGSEHPALVNPWVGLALARIRMRQLKSAGELLARAERVVLERLGPGHPFELEILAVRCELLRAEGKRAEAKRLEKSLRKLARGAADRRHSVSWAEWAGGAAK